MPKTVWAFSLCLAVVAALVTGCTSARKASKAPLRDPFSVVPDESPKIPPPISALRSRALKQGEREGCSTRLTKRIKELAAERWPRAACPENLPQEVSKAMEGGKISHEDLVIFESLKKINCQGRSLLSSMDGSPSLAEEVRGFLGREKFDTASSREIAQERGVLSLHETLQQVLNLNVEIERKVLQHGEFLLTEEHLDFLLGLVGDGCRLKTVHRYFTRDIAAVMVMEQNESLVVDAKVKKKYADLRKDVQTIFDRNIKSFF